MLPALKIVFALFAVYSATTSVRAFNQVPDPAPIIWISVAISLCLVSVTGGMIREIKWAWNCAVGLLICRLLVEWAEISAMFLGHTFQPGAVLRPALRAFVVSTGTFLLVFSLLMIGRRSYQSVFSVASGDQKANGYFRPACLGVLFSLIGLLTLLHPITSQFCPMPLRLTGFIFMAIAWTGALLCFFERRWLVARRLAIAVNLAVVAGFAISFTFYTYFALAGMIFGGMQLLLAMAAIFLIAKAQRVFVT